MTKVRKIAFGGISRRLALTITPRHSYSISIRSFTAPQLGARLTDFGAGRLAEMDAAGIDYAILSQIGPGVQGEPDAAVALAARARTTISWPNALPGIRTASADSRPCPCTIPRPPQPN